MKEHVRLRGLRHDDGLLVLLLLGLLGSGHGDVLRVRGVAVTETHLARAVLAGQTVLDLRHVGVVGVDDTLGLHRACALVVGLSVSSTMKSAWLTLSWRRKLDETLKRRPQPSRWHW